MICKHCKSEIPKGANFCEICGKPVEYPKKKIEATAKKAGKAVADATVSVIKKIGWIIIIIAWMAVIMYSCS